RCIEAGEISVFFLKKNFTAGTGQNRAEGHIAMRFGPVRNLEGQSEKAFELRPVHVTVRAGHCLRLSIQAESFPAFPVNPGTGAPPQDAAVTDRLV
ncbi:CocE/NonD family hydrolase C-terminal non-catalytic domain-containing protein, partial [Rhizobium leguminosarum]|uniref:CocE/NonD family hydrolase C-terminal non-catalytic domain-containing protein n=1 Tax=Rhizobium leguminosarum TaxID=384 RepID=UPI003F9C4E19